MKRDHADVILIGAGVIGCAIARELAHRGAQVTVFERDVPGRGATWAAAGMLSPFGTHVRAFDAGPSDAAPFGGVSLPDLAEQSLSLYESWATALLEETGIDVEYRMGGMLHISFGDDDDELERLAALPAAARFGASLMDRRAALELVPDLSERVTRVLFIERDGRVNNRLLAQAVHAAAIAAGAVVRAARPVAAVLTSNGAVSGVRLESGETVAARTVIVAAGAWSGSIAGLPRPLPVRPVKGQMFAVDANAALADGSRVQRLSCSVLSRGCYIVPREDGRLLVGATVEEAAFREGPTPAGIAGLITSARDAIPRIDELPLVETWSGFRPGTPDHLPIIGRDDSVEGLVYATGHFRNGILLAPATAVIVSAARNL